jgi:phosphoenolpyruvate synthase/pyruvate phosphate dikinase
LDARIRNRLSLRDAASATNIAATGAEIRRWIAEAPLPLELVAQLKSAFDRLDAGRHGAYNVGSSCMDGGRADARLAGQQESYLNVVGFGDVLEKVRLAFAAPYSDRAISHRARESRGDGDIAVCMGIQKTVQAECSGSAFTLDTGSGFRDVVFLTAAFGHGEAVIRGEVNPDEFHVSKRALAEGHFPIVSRRLGSMASRVEAGAPAGLPHLFSLSDPEVVELGKYAVAIEGTCGKPMEIEWAKNVADGRLYILQAQAESVWSDMTTARSEGSPDLAAEDEAQRGMPPVDVEIMMNIDDPHLAYEFSAIPNSGVGLASLEFIIENEIGVHPRAILDYAKLDAGLKAAVDSRSRGYEGPRDFYVEKLREGIATIACAFWPKPVIVRLPDFKTSDYRKLLGGHLYEAEEENPMMGFRGASRYLAPGYAECLQLELEAIRSVRNDMGFSNVQILVPFVRTVDQAARVVGMLEQRGLVRGVDGLQVIMMCELPANAILADQYLQYFDGFTLGSNDLTQLSLGLDHDSDEARVIADFDERDDAVRFLLGRAIKACLAAGKYIGICGKGPSDRPDFADWLMQQGLRSMSLDPDVLVETWTRLAQQARPFPFGAIPFSAG